jgi:hypothetical protein
MDNPGYSTNVNDYLVIRIIGCFPIHIAQVTRSKPLEMKVTETGPFSRLKDGDYIIWKEDSQQLQLDDRNNTDVFLRSCHQAGRKVLSGLKSLGVKDGELHEIFPK